jgi:hypothetical protein
MVHLHIATPAYSGQVTAAYAVSLAETYSLLRQQDMTVTSEILCGGSLLVKDRNTLLEQFWQGTATHLLCIDADLGWPAQAVAAMLGHGRDVVCGIYPARGDAKVYTFRPKLNPDGSILRDGPLLGMEYVPAGFMLLTRHALATMRACHPGLRYAPKVPSGEAAPGYCLFNTEVWEGEFWGEDYVFCRRARASGLDIWCDPLIQFNHAGTVGCIMQALTPHAHEAAILPAPKLKAAE